FWGDVDFGIFARARAGAHFGLFADVAVPNPGSVDVTYPLNTQLTFPDANSFRAGDTVSISSQYTDSGVVDGFLLQTTSPQPSPQTPAAASAEPWQTHATCPRKADPPLPSTLRRSSPFGAGWSPPRGASPKSLRSTKTARFSPRRSSVSSRRSPGTSTRRI